MTAAAAMETETQEEGHTPRLLSVMLLRRFLLWVEEQEHKVPLLLLLAPMSNLLRFLSLPVRVVL
jgi:hypothetical protein